MKKKFQLFATLMLVATIMLPACKEKPDTRQTDVEYIYITNGGLNGTEKYKGEIDKVSYTITFNNVAAETDIEAIRFDASGLSLGAVLDKETYNFLEGNSLEDKELTSTIRVINPAVGKYDDLSQDYTVIIRLADPAGLPRFSKFTVTDDAGKSHSIDYIIDVTVNEANTVLLSMGSSATATITNVELLPKRATYKLTAANASGVISSDNPGMLEITFLGQKNTFALSFADAALPGVAFEKAKVHDFSLSKGNCYPDLAAEDTRSVDFDGEYVLLANNTQPKMFAIRDLLNDNISNPIYLNMNGVAGGTFVVNAGRLTQGHIYLCNLSTSLSDDDPLKVYHYDSPTSAPQVVMTWNGELGEVYQARMGDNMSINLDESGHGYIFFAVNGDGGGANRVYRWEVKNFTDFSGPVELKLPDEYRWFASCNKVGDNQYLYTSAGSPYYQLVNANLDPLASKMAISNEFSDIEFMADHGADARIVKFNKARYLYFTIANSGTMHWGYPNALQVFDITNDGTDDLAAAFKKLEDDSWDDPKFGPTYEYCLLPNRDEALAKPANASTASAAAAEVDGNLVFVTAAPIAGFAVIEVPRAL